ncbi:coproporphyrinogen III oxidase [Sulfurimonas sp. MAG313]|nr:coproporphyrinogen III oxidase [Sulfurimonas sp. MAG313]MDF1881939.1 coproporphyrinogen III oxidase [Sulfurimonas sp. MAG313]
MTRIKALSLGSQKADTLVTHLQSYFVKALDTLSSEVGASKKFEAIEWFRNDGKSGGGVRYVATDSKLFNRASVNISQVQYDNDPTKALASATALSTIIHPLNPYAPSIHMHVSWTEMKDGKGYWRMMADLNPSIFDMDDTMKFQECLQKSSNNYYSQASKQGDKYFFIPVLKRHRGVSHFYLEDFKTENKEADLHMAKALVENVVDTYVKIIKNRILTHLDITQGDKDKQLAYHTLYLFQVLTLDRGTTSGLLVHNQNDIGILGSIPSHVDKALLLSWVDKMPKGQEKLLEAITNCLDEDGRVEEEQKIKLAQTVRKFYQNNPEALKLQASGNVSVPTVQNHK